jgi:DNA processing protein
MNEIEVKIALSMTPGVNASIVRRMIDADVSFDDFFSLDTPKLSARLGLTGRKKFSMFEREEALLHARNEITFIKSHSVKTLFLTDEGYPYRLSECHDAPVMLYMLGDADWDANRFLSMVGTRTPTTYGLSFCDSVIENLSIYFDDINIVSGLAFGIDAASHKAAINHNLPTTAVIAHGLQMIYPAQHRSLAASIIETGGAIVTEYPSGEKPYKQRFLERNRIVAGLSDATVVVESDLKGGAMSTANIAFGYNREVFALPGRASDSMSSGCNHLIKRSKAQLVCNASDIMESMNWKPLGLDLRQVQKNLFPELDPALKPIFQALKASKSGMTLDEIHTCCGGHIADIMSALTEMEFDGIIAKLPGNRYIVSP